MNHNCVISANHLRCLACGESHAIVMPIALSDFSKKCNAFIELHTTCKDSREKLPGNQPHDHKWFMGDPMSIEVCGVIGCQAERTNPNARPTP